MRSQHRTVHVLKSGLLLVWAVLALSACDNGAQEDESSEDTAALYPVAVVTVPALVSVKQDLVETVQSRLAAGEMEDAEEVARLADVLAALETVLQTDLATVLETRDPALATDMMAWSGALANDLLAVVKNDDDLAGQLHDARRLPESGEGESGGGLAGSPGVSEFETSLGGLMDSMSDYMQGGADGDWPGEGADNDRGANTESADHWVNYLNDRVPQGADPDPNDPDVDATGDTWTDYLNDDAAPGADPDRPEEADSGEDDGGTTVVTDDDVVVVWTDEDGDLDRIESTEDDTENGEGNEGGSEGENGTTGGTGDNGDGDADGSGNGDDGTDGNGDPDDDEEMPCDPNIDGCNDAGGELPDHDPNDGTTQPGSPDEDGGRAPTDLDTGEGDLGPLILVGPDHHRGGAVVLVVRSPTYGQTQPGPDGDRFNGGFWAGEPDEIGPRLEQLFSASEALATDIAEVCGSAGC